MAQRTAIYCFKCKQWGVHIRSECKLTADQIKSLTPEDRNARPQGVVVDAQYPNV